MELSESEIQDKCSEFVKREVFDNQSMLIELLFTKEIFEWEDVRNAYECYAGEYEAKEIFEWWIISEHLAEKLKDLGEPILENDYGTWWGRTCTGQAIMLDSVIRKIVFVKDF